MDIMQLLQIVPQAIPPTGTVSEAPADPAADPALFASLFAGLIARPAEGNPATELPETATVAPEEKGAAGTPDAAVAAETALASLVAFIPPPPLPAEVAAVPTEPVPEAGAAVQAEPLPVAGAEIPVAPEQVTVAREQAPVAMTEKPLPQEPAKADASLPAPRPETVQAQPAVTQPSPENQSKEAVPVATNGEVEVLRVVVDAAPKEEGRKQPELRTTEIIPARQENPVPEKQELRTTGPTAAYPDRIPVIPRGSDHQLRPARAAGEEIVAGETPSEPAEVAGQTANAPEVEVIVREEAGERQFSGNRDSGSRKETAARDHAAPPLVAEGARGFEQTVQTRTQQTAEPSRALHDSVMAQVREGVASREGNGNGEITVRLNPVELGELRINVRVVDQQVKVEVLAANSQVRDILLNNLDSLKENFSRQNLTMSGFDVSTGTGQGFDQFFREGRAAGQGAYRSHFGGGPAADDAVVTAQASDYYYTDRRDNSLVDVRF